MISTVEVTTEHIRGKYNVSEAMAHEIIKMILDDISCCETSIMTEAINFLELH